MSKKCGCQDNPQVENSEPSEGFLRWLGAAITGMGVGRTVSPMVSLADMGDDPQYFYLSRRMRFAFGTQVAALGAGLDPYCFLTNPAGSGVIVKVEYAAVQNLSGGTTVVGGHLNRGSLSSGVQLFGINMDGRQPVTGISPTATACRIDRVGVATGTAPLWSRSITNNGLVSLPAPIILTPATQLQLQGIASNLSLGFELIWSERRMYPEEKQ